MLEIITYATHREGKLDELTNNKYNIPVKVLGMGKKWNGFKDKTIGVYEYIKNKNDSDIIVFIDGFDSLINKNITNLEHLFNKFNCGILMSKDSLSYELITKHVFNRCNGRSLNSGMYIGKVKYLKDFLYKSLQYTCKDDQVVYTNVCKNVDYLKVDEDNVIFENMKPLQNNKISEAIFISYPGSISINRVFRSIKEYSQFFLIFMFICYLIICYYFKKHIYAITVLFVVFLLYIDTSCI